MLQHLSQPPIDQHKNVASVFCESASMIFIVVDCSAIFRADALDRQSDPRQFLSGQKDAFVWRNQQATTY